MDNKERDVDYPNKQSWISSRLQTLKHDLYHQIEKHRELNSLIIGSWNIRDFDDGMPRLDESYHYIAEIIDHFDICALQEIKSDLAPLRKLMKFIGPNWDYFDNDVSTHKGGNKERSTFVFNKNKVFFRILIGEVVLPSDEIIAGEQVARTLFFASFQAYWYKFSLCSAHIIFEDNLDLRVHEIKAIAKSVIKRAKKEGQVHIFLGDMNIEKKDDDIMKALKSTKMVVPDFGPTNMSGNRWFDQMAFTQKSKAGNKTRLLRHGKFDWFHAVFGPHPEPDNFPSLPLLDVDSANGKSRLTKQQLLDHYEPIVNKLRVNYGKNAYAYFGKTYKTWTTYEMSDHLPIWMELEIDYSDKYLGRYLR